MTRTRTVGLGRTTVVALVALVVLGLAFVNPAVCVEYEIITSTVSVSNNAVDLNVAFVAPNVSNFEANPQVVLLHGFPEGWYGWIDLIPELLALDNYSLIVPDLPSFNLSSPAPSYYIYDLVDNVASLIQITGQPVTVVAHDWGGVLAWVLANRYPTLLNGLVILNAPHPSVYYELITTSPQQQNDSSYILFFESPEGLPILTAANFSGLQKFFFDEPWFTSERQAIYVEAWSQPNEVNNTLNYYRSNIYSTDGSWQTVQCTFPQNNTVEIPTLVLWGTEDVSFQLPANLDNLSQYVSQLTVQTFNATHWIHHEIPEQIAPYIANFINTNNGYDVLPVV